MGSRGIYAILLRMVGICWNPHVRLISIYRVVISSWNSDVHDRKVSYCCKDCDYCCVNNLE